MLLPPLLYAVVPACEIAGIRLQPLPLTLLLSLCPASFVFTGFLFGPDPNIRNEIAATVLTPLLLLLGFVHPLSYGNYGGYEE